MRKETALISVIVPVYQVADYLEECVDSLLGQTYKNTEIILVDDGSTDGSERLCDAYAEKDKRVRVVHQENGGLSCARNSGLRLAEGAYIAFVDSDDAVEEVFLETLYRLLENYQADIAACSFYKGEKGKENRSERGREYSIASEKMLQEWHGRRKKLETVVWNKLYKRSVFGEGAERIMFPEGRIHEDTYVSHLYVSRAKRIAVTTRKLYFYRVRKESITGKQLTEEAVRQDLEAQLARLSFFREHGYKRSAGRLLAGFWLHRGMYGIRLCRKR